ncbi:PREDICTED: triple functional domain protein-like isoform X1 [Amphimedon queenslandica]|uniref:DH domain-containing protein n=1 Tax=Amphimedon queenslandica TaxID=400682 RepID=A0AAN0J477_AMPQE|nr:PREDICTED: triple functional domain protein-like isoform X1 [Amphimedon queenslandica]|eukprot:XP_019851556.1 PREDICTED: triple functional domain protein-like isoform X1 [Amphimedon queenslandica]
MSSAVVEVPPSLAASAVPVEDPAVSLLPAAHSPSPCEKEEPDLNSTGNEGECVQVAGLADDKSEKVSVDLIDTDTLLESWPHKSGHAVKELILTEKTYLESLEEVINGYLKPLYGLLLQKSQGPQFIETVFCNIRKLHAIHLKVYESLLLAYDKPDEFGKVFEDNSIQFREYIRYCTNFPFCESMLQKTMKKPSDTQRFITWCQIQLGHPLPLITYLHKPVQRILKYKLLLEQILKRFHESTPGQKELMNALVNMSGLAHEINEVKKRQENVTRVKSIEKQLKGLKGSEISGSSLLSYGHLIYEVDCKVLSRRGGERTLLLFEKMLLFLKKLKSETGYIYKGFIKVEELDLTEDSNKETVLSIFSISSPSKRFVVQVRSSRVKEELVQCIQTLLVPHMKRETEPSHESTVEEDERIPSVGHITKKPKMVNLLRQRSLAASTDLQRRRKTRQMSTRKHSLDQHHSASRSDALSGSADSGISISKDSSETISLSIENETEEPRRLHRKTAFRRKKTKKLENDDSVTSELCESSWADHTGLDEDGMSSLDLVSSLDKKPRALTFSSKEDLLHSSGEFIYPENHQRHNTVIGGLRERADLYSVPPDPYEALERNRLLSDITLVEEEEEEEEEEKNEDERGTEDLEEEIQGEVEGEIEEKASEGNTVERRSIFSRGFEDSNESLGSNASSMCLEDHYLLSQTAKSAIIASRDGENIVIYDDTEDSESDYEYEEEEEEEGSERDEIETRGGEEEEERSSSPEPEKKQHTSLRSYLSTSNLLRVPQEQVYFNSKECAYSTLPRGAGLMGVSSPLLYSHRRKIQRSLTSDVLQSLPSEKGLILCDNLSASSSDLSPSSTPYDEQKRDELTSTKNQQEEKEGIPSSDLIEKELGEENEKNDFLIQAASLGTNASPQIEMNHSSLMISEDKDLFPPPPESSTVSDLRPHENEASHPSYSWNSSLAFDDNSFEQQPLTLSSSLFGIDQLVDHHVTPTIDLHKEINETMPVANSEEELIISDDLPNTNEEVLPSAYNEEFVSNKNNGSLSASASNRDSISESDQELMSSGSHVESTNLEILSSNSNGEPIDEEVLADDKSVNEHINEATDIIKSNDAKGAVQPFHNEHITNKESSTEESSFQHTFDNCSDNFSSSNNNDKEIDSPQVRRRDIPKSVNIHHTIAELPSTSVTSAKSPAWIGSKTALIVKYGTAGLLTNCLSTYSQQNLLVCLMLLGIVLFLTVMIGFSYFFYYRNEN